MNSVNVFSDSWYKISNLRVCLLHSVEVVKQTFRDEDVYVLKDAYNNKYFKLSKDAYVFVAKLSLDKTIQEVLDELNEQKPDQTPSQNEIIDLISSLHEQNLLFFKNLPQNDFIYERKKYKKFQEKKNKLISFLFFKVPLINPNNLLNRYQKAIDIVFSRNGFIVWLLFCLYGLKIVIENFSLVYDQAQGMLSPSNILLLYISMAIMKLFHEISHAAVTKKYGGSVNTFGVMFLIFTPLPYMDATHSWFFKSKYKKMLVGFAGMMSDLFFATLAAIVWASTGDGIVHAIAFNVMIIGSVSSLLFNGNPLLRFDAYYILADYLEIPNLYTKSKDYFFYIFERYIFKIEHLESPSDSENESFWLFSYAVLSYIYRLIISVGIVFYVADQLFVVGVLIACISIYMWILSPLKKFTKYLIKSQKLYKSRKRAIVISSAFVFVVFNLVMFFPIAYNIKAPGVIKTPDSVNIYAKTDGFVEEIFVKSGDYVKEGDLIAKLKNKDLELDIKNTEVALSQVDSIKQKFLSKSSNDIKTLMEKKEVLLNKLNYLKNKQNNLVIKAKYSGVFVGDGFDSLKYSYLKRQSYIGKIISSEHTQFFAVVSQEDAFKLFEKKRIIDGGVRFFGHSNIEFDLKDISLIPNAKDTLPSSALGWFGGGDIAVSQDDMEGKKTIELFFEISANIISDDKNRYILKDGRTGVMKIELESTSIAAQIYLSINQLLQKRYKI